MAWDPPAPQNRRVGQPGWCPGPGTVTTTTFSECATQREQKLNPEGCEAIEVFNHTHMLDDTIVDGDQRVETFAPPTASTRTQSMVSWLWTSVTLVAAMLLSSVFAVIAVVTVAGVSGGDPEELLSNPWVQLAGTVGMWIPFTWAFIATAHMTRTPLREVLWSVQRRTLAMAAAAGVLLQGVFIAVGVLAGQGGESPFHPQRWGVFGVVVFVVIVVLGAPIVEELFFRGVVLPTLMSVMSFRLANLIQAGVFGSLHIDQGWFGVVAVTVAGLVLGAVRHRTGTLAASIALHAAFNTTAVVLILTI